MTSETDFPSDSDIKKEFDVAMTLKRDGKLAESEAILKRLVEQRPKSAKLHCALGGVYWDLLKYSSAVDSFGKAVAIAPTLELASLGLFHCLWEQNQRDLAFDEMKRFMSVSDSSDYREIIRELNESDGT